MSTKLVATKDPMRLALGVLMVMTVSRVHQHFGWLAPFRPALLVFGACVAYAYMNPKLLNKGRLLRSWYARVFVALGVIACVSVPFGINMGGSAKYILSNYSKVLIFAFLLLMAIRSVADLYAMVWSFVIGIAVLAFFSVFVFQTHSIGPAGFSRLGEGYALDANDMGLMLVVGVVFSLLLVESRRGFARLLLIGLLLLCTIALIRTGSRGALLGLGCTLVSGILLLRHISPVRRVVPVAVASLAFVALAPPAYWDQMSTMLNPKEDYNWDSDTGRRQIWIRGIGYMLARPIAGLGVENFGLAEATLSERARNAAPGQGIKWSAPHNTFIQAGAEMGIPGLVVFTALVLGGIGRMIALARRIPPSWRRGDAERRFMARAPSYLAVAMVAFLVSAFFVSFVYWDLVYIIASFMAATEMLIRDLRTGHADGMPAVAALQVRPNGRFWRMRVSTANS